MLRVYLYLHCLPFCGRREISDFVVDLIIFVSFGHAKYNRFGDICILNFGNIELILSRKR